MPHILDTAAWIYFRQGNFSKALDLLVGVEDKVKKAPLISYHLGMIYFELGEKEKAEEYLERSVGSKEEFPGKKEAREALMRLSD